ncbi:MAG TPA: hypothetical protein EYQ86_01610, partial [Bacteroidetes bacterium]|nr:hypothetical protein [Bacteroidota bacterium]
MPNGGLDPKIKQQQKHTQPKKYPNKKIISIDKGRKEGIFEGQNVLGLKGLIGQVIEVNYLTSKVLLISDLNHNVPAQITRTGEKL